MGFIELEWLKIWNIQLLIIVGFCLVSILSLTPHFTSSSFHSLLDRRPKREENHQLKFQFPEWRGTQISPTYCSSSSFDSDLVLAAFLVAPFLSPWNMFSLLSVFFFTFSGCDHDSWSDDLTLNMSLHLAAPWLRCQGGFEFLTDLNTALNKLKCFKWRFEGNIIWRYFSADAQQGL